MKIIETEIQIDAAPERVWDILVDDVDASFWFAVDLVVRGALRYSASGNSGPSG